MALSRESCFDRFVADLATVVSALVDAPAIPGPAGEAPQGGWIVTLQAEQAVRGVLVAHFDRTGADRPLSALWGWKSSRPGSRHRHAQGDVWAGRGFDGAGTAVRRRTLRHRVGRTPRRTSPRPATV